MVTANRVQNTTNTLLYFKSYSTDIRFKVQHYVVVTVTSLTGHVSGGGAGFTGASAANNLDTAD